MDNIEAMDCFLSESQIHESHVLLNDGTQVSLFLPGYRYYIVIDSSGLGDTFSHQFEVTRIPLTGLIKQARDKNQSIGASSISSSLEQEIESLSGDQVREIFNFVFFN
jgi:hypothetical protein